MVTTIRIPKRKVTGFHQQLQVGEVKFRVVSINIPEKVLAKVDSQLGRTKETKNRDHLLLSSVKLKFP